MGATLRQISETTGLSYVTVADILSPLGKRRGRYSEQTRRQIEETAVRLGYRPNRGAQAISTGRFGSIALLTSTVRNLSNIPPEMLEGIQDALEAKDLHLSVARVGNSRLTDPTFVPKILREWAADGLLVDYTHAVPAAMQQLIEENSLPAIWVNNKRPADTIRPDDYQAGVVIAEALLRKGHRRIAYLQLSHGLEDVATIHYNVLDRIAGVEETVRRAGYEARTIFHSRAMEESAWLDWAKAFLSTSDRPTAVVTPGGGEAGVILMAALSLGIDVPRDLSIVMIADDPYAVGGQYVCRAGVSRRRLGREAVEMLLEKIELGTKFEARLLPYQVFEDGNTIGPPPGEA